MKTFTTIYLFSVLAFFGCTNSKNETLGTLNETNLENAVDPSGGQAAVSDDVSQKNILRIALGSAAHTTLVAAVKAASYENALVNAGPFTVFAPTNDAFAQLPAGTVDELVKPENKLQLQDILEHHVYIGNLKTENLTDGMVLGMANGGKVSCAANGETITVNGAKIIASVPCANGIVHVIDKVLLPK